MTRTEKMAVTPGLRQGVANTEARPLLLIVISPYYIYSELMETMDGIKMHKNTYKTHVC